jgi:hypothetical protein
MKDSTRGPVVQPQFKAKLECNMYERWQQQATLIQKKWNLSILSVFLLFPSLFFPRPYWMVLHTFREGLSFSVGVPHASHLGKHLHRHNKNNFGNIGILTQGFMLERQVLHLMSNSTSPFCSGSSGNRILLFAQASPDHGPPILYFPQWLG